MSSRPRAHRRLEGLLVAGILLPLAGVTATLASPPAAPYVGPPPSAFTIAAHSAVFDVRALPAPATGPDHERDRPEREAPRAADTPNGPLAPIGSGVGGAGSAPAPAPGASFEGLAYNDDCGGVRCGQGHPPDTNGDVGTTDYIETVNTSIGIYAKTTGTRVAAFSFDALMSQGAFGNLCDTNNFGDPVVLYDTFASRWIISDFAFELDSSGNVVNPPGSYQCFAVSKSADPVSGGWNFYSIHITDALQDYPKFGIWPDGLYMSANMFAFNAGGAFQNVRVWALNKTQMEAGATAQVVQFDAPAKTGACPIVTLLPSNARVQTGTPPVGRENLFASVWCYTTRVRIFKFHVDWSNTASSTFTGPTDSTTATPWSGPPSTVPEKDGNPLDTLGIRMMMQNQYSNIAGVESLWDSHTVAGSSASQAAIRYYQVPVTGGTIGSAIQAATYNPDSKNRWLPSVAVDRAGDMAIGYSVADAATYPAIRYAGRLAGDAVNTITQTETSLIAGTGAQVGNCGSSACERWGDYSAMTLDPDGCTFWYTNEYYGDLSLNDHTRIGSFSFPSCVSSPPPSQPPPTPTPSPSHSPSPSPSPTSSGDKTPPTVSSFAPTTASSTNAASVGYALTFSEAVTGLSAGDFSHTGTATGCAVGTPSGSVASYTLSVSGCSGGTLALTLNANTVSDTSANLGPTGSSTAATVTIDRSAPGATLTGPTSPTKATTLGYSIGFTEPVTGLSATDFSISGTATACLVGSPTGSGSAYAVSLTGCSAGTVVLTLTGGSVLDAAGNAGPPSNVSAASVLIDRTAPVVTAPTATLRPLTTLSGSSFRMAIRWSATDAGGAGVLDYEVARSLDGAAFTFIASAYTSTTLGAIISPGHTYRYEVRAHDRAGNLSSWVAGPTLRPSLLQQTSTSIGYHGTWTTVTSTVFSGGTARYATAAGAYASYTFSGRSIGFVSSRGPTRGAVKIYIDGSYVTTIDLYQSTYTYRWVAYAQTWSTVGTHTIKVIVVGTAGRPRVDLDAFEVVR